MKYALKYQYFFLFFIVVAFAITACKKTTKPISSLDYYVENRFDDSIKLNAFYEANPYSTPRDTTIEIMGFKAKERRFITSGVYNVKRGSFDINNELINSYSYATVYGVRANGDTIRPSKSNRLLYGGYGAQSLTYSLYWKKEINEDTGAAVYTLELH